MKLPHLYLMVHYTPQDSIIQYLYKNLHIFQIFLLYIELRIVRSNDKNIVIDQIVDMKDFRKLLRTKSNVLVCFTKSMRSLPSTTIKNLKEAALVIKGQGTIVLIDCGGYVFT